MSIKNVRKIISGRINIKPVIFSLIAAAALAVTACGSSSSSDSTESAARATDFQFDFDSGAYSFEGVEKGRTYCIRLYAIDEDGKDEENYTFTSSNILANDDGSQDYSGTVDLSEECEPGAKYHAYVMATTEDYKRGMSDGVEGTYIGIYDTPGAVTAAKLDGDMVEVTMDQAVFDPYKALDNPPDSYTLTLYNGDTASQTVQIQDADLSKEDEDYIKGFGPQADTGTYHHRSGSATFTGVSDASDDDLSVTIQADGKENVYHASAESEKTQVTE